MVNRIEYHFEDELERYCSLAFVVTRYIPVRVRQLLKDLHLTQDFIQEVYTAAIMAHRQGLDDRETFRFVGRQIYQFLKAWEIKRKRPSAPYELSLWYGQEIYPVQYSLEEEVLKEVSDG
ncbi:hypothetical protein DRN34_05580 [Thermococci archaeon]|nr:MAG: hypothetical protein DRN34_05580 [Thermococci archaeon]